MNNSTPVTPEKTFSSMQLLPEILTALTKNEINIPTPIQAQGIPVALENKDIVGIAQTGTGKTLAFGLPTLQKIKKEAGHALIMVPTRELAYQVYESMKPYANALQIGMIVIVGGEPIFKQKRAIRMRPSIVIATPGRLNDHLRQKSIILSGVKTLILDEADQMLDMGFKPQIEEAIAFIPKERQTMLFSATMAKSILELATKYMHLPLHIEVAPAGTAAKNVEQEIFIVHRDEKHALLQTCLEQHKGKALVFCRTKHGCTKLTKYLTDKAFSAAEIHGNRSLSQRKFALQNFKNGTVRILVATDIAARGIHVDNIECVINFDLPEDSEDYVHRIGRTARAGTKGKAISFATSDQHGKIRGIEKLMRMTIPKGKMPDTFTKVDNFDRAPQRSSSGGRGGFGGGRGGNRGGFGGGRNSRPGGGSSFGSRPPRKFSGNRDSSSRNSSR